MHKDVQNATDGELPGAVNSALQAAQISCFVAL